MIYRQSIYRGNMDILAYISSITSMQEGSTRLEPMPRPIENRTRRLCRSYFTAAWITVNVSPATVIEPVTAVVLVLAATE